MVAHGQPASMDKRVNKNFNTADSSRFYSLFPETPKAQLQTTKLHLTCISGNRLSLLTPFTFRFDRINAIFAIAFATQSMKHADVLLLPPFVHGTQGGGGGGDGGRVLLLCLRHLD